MTGKRKTNPTDYKNLLPLGSGSEDEDDDDETSPATDCNSHLISPEVQIHDTKNNSNFANSFNKTGYKFSGSKNKETSCSPTRAAMMFALIILFFGVGYIAGFFTPYTVKIWSSEKSNTLKKRSAPWRTKISDYGTESSVRLVDCDGDGLDDVIMGLALGKNTTVMVTEESMAKFCHSLGLKMPCAGAVVALRGYDGKLLWKVDSYSEVFGLNCHAIDVNKDGTKDCIASGRLATLQVINPKNGEVFWRDSSKYLYRGWNIYSTNAIQDMDYDGVGEIIISHGGDPTVPSAIHQRHPGCIMMISGATGIPIGRRLYMPESKEIYISPVIHERRDGSQYILYGSGGETVGGLFLAISIPDFYRYVHKLPRYHLVPNVRGRYDKWGFKSPDADGVIELFRSDAKGVMVPPVLADVNNDGVEDILMSGFDGTMILYNGETLEIMWKVKFDDRESYSSPSPGYFNDDDVIDFMVHWSSGAWPYYNSTDAIVMDGKDGAVLWNITSNRYDVSSDLTVRSQSRNRDVFFFRLQGRNGKEERRVGAIHGATGIQRIVERRSLADKSSDFVDTEITEENSLVEDVLLPEHHFRSRREAKEKGYVECESDQTVFLAEMFALDRTVMKKPLKVWEKASEKYYYKLSKDDRKLAEGVLKKYNHSLSETEIPWTRGKRALEKSLCVVVQPDERTTGAIGDVDGDGKLDVIVNLVSVGIIRDEYANFVKMKFDSDVYKLSLEDVMNNPIYTPVNASVHERMKYVDNENDITTLKFLPKNQQTWAGYMGTYGNSVF